jgi:hypothetical protein
VAARWPPPLKASALMCAYASIKQGRVHVQE